MRDLGGDDMTGTPIEITTATQVDWRRDDLVAKYPLGAGYVIRTIWQGVAGGKADVYASS